eukprot:jgi/Tetstr1/422906/TSEL_013688.t2
MLRATADATPRGDQRVGWVAAVGLLAVLCLASAPSSTAAAELPPAYRHHHAGQPEVAAAVTAGHAEPQCAPDTERQAPTMKLISTADFFAGTGVSAREAARYNVSHIVGSGNQAAVVAAAVDLRTGGEVVIKKFQGIESRLKAQQVLNEITVHQRLTALGGQVVQLRGILVPEDPQRWDSMLIVMERMETGLNREVRALQPSSLQVKKLMAYQMLAGLRDMHSAGYIHGDVQAKNMLLRGNCTLRLADFGFSVPIKSKDMRPQHNLTLPIRRAVQWHGGHLPAADVWNVGRTLLSLGLGADMLRHKNWVANQGYTTWLLEYGPPPPDLAEYFSPMVRAAMRNTSTAALTMEQLFPGVEPEVMRFCKRLLNWDLLQLPSAAELLREPFFDDVRSDPLVAETGQEAEHGTAADAAAADAPPSGSSSPARLTSLLGPGVSAREAARYNVSHIVGSGNQAAGVAAAVDLRTREEVVIKKYQVTLRRTAHQVLNEITIHQRLTELGGKVVQLRGILVPEDPQRWDSVLIVMERMDTALNQEVRALQPSSLRVKKLMAYQMLAGLRDMHSAGYIHGDMYSKNMLLRGNCTLRLADFGFSVPIKSTGMRPFRKLTVPMRRVVQWHGGHLPAADVWNVGRTLLSLGLGDDMVSRKKWTPSRGYQDLAARFSPMVRAAMRNTSTAALTMEQLFPGVEPEVMRFCKRLLNWDLLQLPSAAELLREPFFDDVRSDPLVAETGQEAERGTAADADAPPGRLRLPSDWRRAFAKALRLAASGAAWSLPRLVQKNAEL